MEQLPSPHSAPSLPTPYEAAATVIAGFPPARPRARLDGWTPQKQRAFCEALADTGVVRDAAALVGMTPQSAYQLKRRAEGRGFSLAWNAALLLARQRLIDMAIERAIDGNNELYMKDGEVVGERYKKDVRHLLAAITKLENIQDGDPVTSTIADDFDSFLDCMEADAQSRLALPMPNEDSVDQTETDGKAKRQRSKSKPAPSPLITFFQDRECGPGLDGHEFETVLDRLSRPENSGGAKAVQQRPAKSKRTKTSQSARDADDDIWSDWDRDPFDLSIF
jgi:hypothetical protein